MTRSRSATDTIRGYYYQFDYFILKILECQNDDDEITIEGIEDVDLTTADETTAIQCKFYSKTEYNHSVIAPALYYMMKHYLRKSNPRIRYKIYGFYKKGIEKLETPLTVDFFKTNFMSLSVFKNIEISDNEIEDFLDVLEIDNNAQAFDQQEMSIREKVKYLFNCSDFEAEHYYYNNALYVVRELATNQNVEKRIISKQKFIDRINNKDILFNCWYVYKKGVEKYCSSIKKEYFSITFNSSPYERFFLIECDSLISESEIKFLLIGISRKWCKISRREPQSFCPYVYLHAISLEKLNSVMTGLRDDNFTFIDGYDFRGSSFSVQSIVKKATAGNGIQLKIIHERDMIDLVLNSVTATREIYQFFTTKVFYQNANSMHRHLKIPVEQTKDINCII